MNRRGFVGLLARVAAAVGVAPVVRDGVAFDGATYYLARGLDPVAHRSACGCVRCAARREGGKVMAKLLDEAFYRVMFEESE